MLKINLLSKKTWPPGGGVSFPYMYSGDYGHFSHSFRFGRGLRSRTSRSFVSVRAVRAVSVVQMVPRFIKADGNQRATGFAGQSICDTCVN